MWTVGEATTVRLMAETSSPARRIADNIVVQNTKHKNAKYKNAKEEEKRNGLGQNTANTTAQKYNVEKHKGWREKTN